MLQDNIAVGLSALNFLYDPIPKASWTFSPLAVGLTAYGAFSPSALSGLIDGNKSCLIMTFLYR
jgi:hypothetical protein